MAFARRIAVSKVANIAVSPFGAPVYSDVSEAISHPAEWPIQAFIAVEYEGDLLDPSNRFAVGRFVADLSHAPTLHLLSKIATIPFSQKAHSGSPILVGA